MSKLIEVIRAVVRPGIALGSVAATIIFILYHIPIPEPWWGILGSAITFYFVQRHDEKKVGP